MIRHTQASRCEAMLADARCSSGRLYAIRKKIVATVPSHRKISAILSGDVAGYSRLMADDERATIETLHAYRQVIRERIERHEGRVIDLPGDAILAEFPSAVEAVDCAQEIQRELGKRNAHLAEHRRMLFRIGINLGDVIEQDGALYGDGVNIACRLEALAEPGSLCVSGTVYDQIEGKLPLLFRFAGEQAVKNIPTPVRAYHWVQAKLPAGVQRTRRKTILAGSALCALLLSAGIDFLWWNLRAPHDLPSYARTITAQQGSSSRALNAKSRLAVLPLTNISANSENEYFADGMTEALISRLSRVSGLDIIARTSVMQYKGKSASVADIGRDLRVNTVLEGSVRKDGDKVRITVQLIDVASQSHLWSEDYDRDLKDVLATQSEISERVANVITCADCAGRLAGNRRLRDVQSVSERAISLDQTHARWTQEGLLLQIPKLSLVTLSAPNHLAAP